MSVFWLKKIHDGMSGSGSTTTSATAAPLASAPTVVTSTATQLSSVANPSATNIVEIYNGDILVYIVLPNTSPNFNTPLSLPNGMKLRNAGATPLTVYLNYLSS